MKEAGLQKRILEYLRAAGCYVFKPVGSMGQQRGTPDLLICNRGLFIAAEIKIRGNEPDAMQFHEMEKIKRAGGTAEVVHRLEEMERIISAARV